MTAKCVPQRIPLPLVPRELARLIGQTSPSYRALYSAALDGRILAELGANGRWTVAQADLPEIAKAFGIGKHSPLPVVTRGLSSAATAA